MHDSADAASTDNTIKISLCQHIKPDGIRCGSPARRGQPLCYFHGSGRPALHRARRTYNPYPAPASDDPRAIAAALHRIMDDLAADRADLTCTRRALATLYAITLGQR